MKKKTYIHECVDFVVFGIDIRAIASLTLESKTESQYRNCL